MGITIYKMFAAGEVLTASDMNSLQTHFVNNADQIGWPAAANRDMDGYALYLDSSATSALQASTNNLAKFILSAKDLFFWDGTVATPVNGMTWVASAAGSAVEMNATGEDTDIDIDINPKGSGVVNIPTAAFSIDASQVTAGTFADARVAESNVKQHEAALDHDALTNFVADEHIDWSVTGAEDIHADRISAGSVTQHEGSIDHDALANFLAAEHVDWAVVGAEVLANSRIQESGVTQHEAALAVATSQLTGQLSDATLQASNVTQFETELESVLDHDDLQGFVSQEHIRWDQSGATQLANARVAESNITQHEAAIDHDALTNFVALEHIDWSNTGPTDLHDDRVAESSVTQHEAALSIAASQVGTGSFDLNGTGSLIGDADGNSTIHATVNNRWDFATAGVDRMQLDTASLLMGVDLDMNGNKIDLDADRDTSIHSSTDDQIDLELGGSDRVRFTTAQVDLVNVDLDMNGNDIVSSTDVFIKGAPYKQARNSTTTLQTLSSTTEANLTGLNGLLLPITSGITSRTFQVEAVVCCNDSGLGSRAVTIRLYNGSNGNMSDTQVGIVRGSLNALESTTITLDVTFTPGASSSTRIGLSAQLSSAVATQFNNGFNSTIRVRQVIE